MTALERQPVALAPRPATVLLTLGRLPKSMELARAFAALGHRVLVAEPHAWHLCRPSRDVARCFQVPAPSFDAEGYLAALESLVAREGVGLVVPVSEETMHASALKPRLPPGVELYCPPQATLLELHDKLRFIEVARSAGLAVPATVPLEDAAPARALAQDGEVVVKPRFSCSGRGVEFFAAGAALPARPEPSVAQRRVRGQVLSTFSVAHQGQVLVTAVYRAVVLSGTVAVCFERVEHAGVIRWVRDFVAARGHSGFISFDFVVDGDDRAWAIECNPRVTSGVHFVEPLDLARAILHRVGPPPEVRLKSTTLAQQAYPVLTEMQRAFFDVRRYRFILGHLLRARDVVWQWRDPLPFLTMTATAWPILSHAWRHGVSLGEASTFDIEWYGQSGQAPAALKEARAP